jgi:hypothetical protein
MLNGRYPNNSRLSPYIPTIETYEKTFKISKEIKEKYFSKICHCL